MAVDPLVGKVLAERYEILERIGEGGTGVVYRGRQVSLNRAVAVKVLGAHVAHDGTWAQRFRNEALALGRLRSAHTVRVYEAGETAEGLSYIAMELLEGGRTLRDELDRVGRMAPERALAIVEQACLALEEAHACGILHRDLKPDNVYLNQAPGSLHVRVLDFSVAKLEGAALQTHVNVAVGTPAYMSPEHVRGGQGPRSDVYALGVLLFEMMAGRPPFVGASAADVLKAHLMDAAPSLLPYGAPADVAALVARALAKDPAARPGSCRELGAACRAAIHAIENPTAATAATIATTTAMRATLLAPATTTPATANKSAPDARTLFEMAAPRLPPVGEAATTSATAATADRTLVLPDSTGITAFERIRAEQARREALAAAAATLAPSTQRPASALFWSAWVLLGMGLGIATWLVQATGVLAPGGA